jgi:anti-anti-sigma regulatory factor
MTTNAVSMQLEQDGLADVLRHDAVENLGRAAGEMVLDFSAVRRIDAGSALAMEELAGLAGTKSVKLVLRAVNIDVYRVLKLLKLAGRFSFVS